ncbi:MAG: thermopsin family protease [Thermoplasmata archaeon]
MSARRWGMLGAIVLVGVLLASALSGASASAVVPNPSPTTAAPSLGTPSLSGATPDNQSTSTTFETNSGLAATVASDEQSLSSSGRNPSALHPPNLHQAPSLATTGGAVTPLYSIAPAPMGVGYYGLSDTTGRTRATTVDTTSLAGTYSTSDPLGTQTEEFDVSTGSGSNDIQPAQDSYGAQLNAVLTNATIFGHTSFYNPSDPDAPTGCPGYGSDPMTGPAPCPNEFWMQNYIEYVPGTDTMQIGDEVWNFSNPSANWGVYNGSTVDQNSLVGFGSISDGLYYLTNTPSEYGPTIHIAYPFTLVLYINITRGPCHPDTVPGTGVPSCSVDGTTVSTTEPVNEIFFNYSVWKTPSQPCPSGDVCQGQHVCPAVEPYPGVVCGEYDDLFFNSVDPATPSVGVPVHGPHGRIGSAAIEANGSAYDPVGLTNDYEFDYGIGSDDGDTNSVVYANGTVGVDYCTAAHTEPNGACSAYSATPAASNFGGETGETSTGEMEYWAPQPTPDGAGLFLGAGAPVAHQVTGPSLLMGLWNMSGAPYPGGSGAHALSYAHIAPANAWVGIAAGSNVRSQSKFQVAPTFGWFSYWGGSGGARTSTELGSNLYLPTGKYTIEVLLSGYAPYIGDLNLKKTGQAPTITLTPDPGTGVYTPLWAFSSSDLGNLSTNAGSRGVGTVGDPYLLEHSAPTVGAPFGVAGSLSWLFSNLNDYLFPVWYGQFLNSTTAYAESDPAPSYQMEYPDWQLSSLEHFDVPTTAQFQMYFLDVQDFTLAGTSGISSWGTYFAVPIASVVCDDCEHDLIAGDSFNVSDLGLQFIDGGRSVPKAGFPDSTRNVIWGNTFTPDPQANDYPGLFPPSTALTVAESFDRIYNNAFEAYSPHLVATARSSPGFRSWWNATCPSGYDPLGSNSYPGPTVCEPVRYAQSVNGFTLTGSIVGSSYQGGNFWAAYGNAANPYGNLPFKDRGASGPGGIGSSKESFAGDYAPLVTTTVYKVTFEEKGLPSDSAKAFRVALLSATGGPALWKNQSATSATPQGCSSRTICVTFYVPNGVYEFRVSKPTDSGTVYLPNPASGYFTVAGHRAPTTRISFVADPRSDPASAALSAASVLALRADRSSLRGGPIPA